MAERDSKTIDRKKFEKLDLRNNLNPKELQHLKDYFKSIDATNTNELDINQLKLTLEKFGIDLNNDESFKELFDKVEKDGSTSIDFGQFVDLITEKLSEIDSMDKLEKVFELFVEKENVDKIEFKHLKKICPDLKDEEIEEMIKKADEDKDGKINFEEFYNIISKKI